MYLIFVLYYKVKQHQFRELFRSTAPFAYDSQDEYRRIDRVSACTVTCTVHYSYCLTIFNIHVLVGSSQSEGNGR